MRILFIYREYMGRRKNYGLMMQKLGHEVIFLHASKKSNPKKNDIITIKHIKKYKPDLIWLLTSYYLVHNVITKETQEYIRKKKIPIALYGAYAAHAPYTEWMKTWKKIDFLFIHHKGMVNWLNSKGVEAHYMPLAFYPEQYYKTNNTKKYNITFMGNLQNNIHRKGNRRIEYIQSLKEYGITVFGESFRSKLKGIKVYKYSTHIDQRRIYARSKINLGMPFTNSNLDFYKKMPNVYNIKNRFFEIPATNNFLLTIRCPDFLEFFDEDAVGYFDDNKESLKEAVDKYLKDDDIREKMASRAYKIAQDNTYLHRFKDMFKIIKNN